MPLPTRETNAQCHHKSDSFLITAAYPLAGASSKIPAPGTNKHRVSPSFGQSSDAAKANHSAWMFGQHKNARVVCQNVRTLD